MIKSRTEMERAYHICDHVRTDEIGIKDLRIDKRFDEEKLNVFYIDGKGVDYKEGDIVRLSPRDSVNYSIRKFDDVRLLVFVKTRQKGETLQ